ncbi:MAG: hypothetical protein ACH346_01925 [Chthoniobacterales bacterium]
MEKNFRIFLGIICLNAISLTALWADIKYVIRPEAGGYGQKEEASEAGRLKATDYSLERAEEDSSSATSTQTLLLASDYCAFLNAVAATDLHHLYDEKMSSDPLVASIMRMGEPGAYRYQVIAGRENAPIYYMNSGDKKFYCRWLSNGNIGDENYFTDRQEDDLGLLASNQCCFDILSTKATLGLVLSSSNTLAFSDSNSSIEDAAAIVLLVACMIAPGASEVIGEQPEGRVSSSAAAVSSSEHQTASVLSSNQREELPMATAVAVPFNHKSELVLPVAMIEEIGSATTEEQALKGNAGDPAEENNEARRRFFEQLHQEGKSVVNMMGRNRRLDRALEFTEREGRFRCNEVLQQENLFNRENAKKIAAIHEIDEAFIHAAARGPVVARCTDDARSERAAEGIRNTIVFNNTLAGRRAALLLQTSEEAARVAVNKGQQLAAVATAIDTTREVMLAQRGQERERLKAVGAQAAVQVAGIAGAKTGCRKWKNAVQSINDARAVKEANLLLHEKVQKIQQLVESTRNELQRIQRPKKPVQYITNALQAALNGDQQETERWINAVNNSQKEAGYRIKEAEEDAAGRYRLASYWAEAAKSQEKVINGNGNELAALSLAKAAEHWTKADEARSRGNLELSSRWAAAAQQDQLVAQRIELQQNADINEIVVNQIQAEYYARAAEAIERGDQELASRWIQTIKEGARAVNCFRKSEEYSLKAHQAAVVGNQSLSDSWSKAAEQLQRAREKYGDLEQAIKIHPQLLNDCNNNEFIKAATTRESAADYYVQSAHYRLQAAEKVSSSEIVQALNMAANQVFFAGEAWAWLADGKNNNKKENVSDYATQAAAAADAWSKSAEATAVGNNIIASEWRAVAQQVSVPSELSLSNMNSGGIESIQTFIEYSTKAIDAQIAGHSELVNIYKEITSSAQNILTQRQRASEASQISNYQNEIQRENHYMFYSIKRANFVLQTMEARAQGNEEAARQWNLGNVALSEAIQNYKKAEQYQPRADQYRLEAREHIQRGVSKYNNPYYDDCAAKEFREQLTHMEKLATEEEQQALQTRKTAQDKECSAEVLAKKAECFIKAAEARKGGDHALAARWTQFAALVEGCFLRFSEAPRDRMVANINAKWAFLTKPFEYAANAFDVRAQGNKEAAELWSEAEEEASAAVQSTESTSATDSGNCLAKQAEYVTHAFHARAHGDYLLWEEAARKAEQAASCYKKATESSVRDDLSSASYWRALGDSAALGVDSYTRLLTQTIDLVDQIARYKINAEDALRYQNRGLAYWWTQAAIKAQDLVISSRKRLNPGFSLDTRAVTRLVEAAQKLAEIGHNEEAEPLEVVNPWSPLIEIINDILRIKTQTSQALAANKYEEANSLMALAKRRQQQAKAEIQKLDKEL